MDQINKMIKNSENE